MCNVAHLPSDNICGLFYMCHITDLLRSIISRVLLEIVMATKKTKTFEIFETIQADGSGETKTIDLNSFVQVADMEAFGLQAIEIGVEPTDSATASTDPWVCQVAVADLSAGFISHAEFDSLYVGMSNGVGNTQTSLSLGDVAAIRYVPGGLLDLRADRMGGANSVNLYVRIAGVISKLSASDYVSLATTQALSA